MYKTVVVIGGSGFLGSHLVAMLISRGFKVRILDLIRPKEGLGTDMEFFYGSMMDKRSLTECLESEIYAVFLVASPPPLSNDEKLFNTVNFFGTRNVLEICKIQKINRLILTSSASVVFDGFHDVIFGDESLPYAENSLDSYTRSKIMQEKAVLSSNCEELATMALRPHGIFGPRDSIFPSVEKNCKSLKRFLMIGSGTNLADFTFVENVCYAHVLAMEKLEPHGILAGNAYNITNDEPVFFWSFIGRIMEGYKSAKPSVSVPFFLLFAFAVFLHLLSVFLSPFIKFNPKLSPMMVSLSGLHHYYSCERAKRDMGYSPVVSVSEGVEKTMKYHGIAF